MKNENGLFLRLAVKEDAGKLLEIYTPYVDKTAITFEYEAPTLEEFTGRINRTLVKYPFIVAEKDGRLFGFAYASPFKERPAYDWAIETSIYVREDFRKSGVGRLLHSGLEAVLCEQGVLNMNACIAYPTREDPYLTRDSEEFHARMGYRLVGEFKECGYKFGRWYDMIWMEKLIGAHLNDQPPVKPLDEVRDVIAEKYDIR